MPIRASFSKSPQNLTSVVLYVNKHTLTLINYINSLQVYAQIDPQLSHTHARSLSTLRTKAWFYFLMRRWHWRVIVVLSGCIKGGGNQSSDSHSSVSSCPALPENALYLYRRSLASPFSFVFSSSHTHAWYTPASPMCSPNKHRC